MMSHAVGELSRLAGGNDHDVVTLSSKGRALLLCDARVVHFMNRRQMRDLRRPPPALGLDHATFILARKRCPRLLPKVPRGQAGRPLARAPYPSFSIDNAVLSRKRQRV